MLGLQTLSLIAMLAMLSQNRRQRESLANLGAALATLPSKAPATAAVGLGHRFRPGLLLARNGSTFWAWTARPADRSSASSGFTPEDRDEVQALLGAHLEGRTRASRATIAWHAATAATFG